MKMSRLDYTVHANTQGHISLGEKELSSDFFVYVPHKKQELQINK